MTLFWYFRFRVRERYQGFVGIVVVVFGRRNSPSSFIHSGQSFLGQKYIHSFICTSTCFPSVCAPEPSQPRVPALAESSLLPLLTSSASDIPDLCRVPSCYLDLKESFSKACAITLPHQCYDCPIDLLSGTAPKDCLYSLSFPSRGMRLVRSS